MQTAQGKFAVKLLPSMTDFAFLVPLAFLFGRLDGVKSLLGDCDTGWHIRTGEWILANHQAPMRDVFSFSRSGAPWYAWEWLSDVLFAWLRSWGGLQAVVLFAMLLISASMTGLYLLARRRSNPVVAIAVTVAAMVSSSQHWLARPHLFTLFFLVLFYAGLERVREGHERIFGVPILALLPPAMILWTNLHGGFFVGILTIGAYGAGEILRTTLAPWSGDRSAMLRSARQYLLCAAACLAASLINPYGWRLHVHIVEYLRDPWAAEHIREFFTLSFHHPLAMFFELLLALAVPAAVVQIRKGNFTEPVLMVVWAHGALLAARNIEIFVIFAAPPVAAMVWEWLQTLPSMEVAGWLRAAAERAVRILREAAVTESLPRIHVLSLLGAALIVLMVTAPNPPKKFRAEFDPAVYPAKAVEMLKADPTARIFTHDEWGDYLIYSLYPGHRVFVDGRSDFYGDAFEKQYIDVLDVSYGWEETLSRFGVNTILMPPSAPLTGALKESSKWRVVYDDGIALIFRATNGARGQQVSVAAKVHDGEGRDREVTKTLVRDRGITQTIKPI